MYVIFDILPLADIITCQRLSKTWSAALREWMQYRQPLATKVRPFWPRRIPQSVGNAQIREHAASFYRISLGNARSSSEHPGQVHVAGDFAIVNNKRRGKCGMIKEVIAWQDARPSSDATTCHYREYAATKFIKGIPSINPFRQMILGHDGTFLAKVAFQKNYASQESQRIVVVSPAENMQLWASINDRRVHNLARMYPLAVGKTLMYYAARSGDDYYDLATLNFRTQKFEYAVTPLHPDWIWLDYRRYHYYSRDSNQYTPKATAFSVDGDELLMLTTELHCTIPCISSKTGLACSQRGIMRLCPGRGCCRTRLRTRSP
ncbi:hypothetical protein BDV18DRAFT_69242 [Aspergillus unguis]